MKVGDAEVLTLSEAAERLRVKRNTLAQQVRNGKLAAILSGHVYLVTAEEVTRYDRERKDVQRGFASPNHPLHGKQGPGHRRKGGSARDESGTDG